MGAKIFNNLDETKLATTFGGMTTYYQVGDLVAKFAISFMVLVFKVYTIIIVYGAVLVAVTLYVICRRQTAWIKTWAS